MKAKELINRFKTAVSGRLHSLVMWAESRKKKKAINNIKAHMLFFGFDISDMTDEEIEKGVIKAGEIFSKTGVAAKEAAVALRQLSSAMQLPA